MPARKTDLDDEVTNHPDGDTHGFEAVLAAASAAADAAQAAQVAAAAAESRAAAAEAAADAAQAAQVAAAAAESRAAAAEAAVEAAEARATKAEERLEEIVSAFGTEHNPIDLDAIEDEPTETRETVWFYSNGRHHHVDVGSAAYDRLLGEGEVPLTVDPVFDADGNLVPNTGY